MTTTLAAVYAPIGFLGGITGSLFKEFAFTLAGTVIISGVIALTLSPMLCSKIINHTVVNAPLVKKIDRFFIKIREAYRRRLIAVLNYRPIVLLVGAVVLASCGFFFLETKQELAPFEDQGYIMVFGNAPTAANLNYISNFNKQINTILASSNGAANTFTVDGYPSTNNLLAGTIYKPWGERSETTMQVLPILQKQLAAVPGIQLYSALNPPLPGVQGTPIQFVITSTKSQADIYGYANTLISDAYDSGLFIFLNTDVMFDQPELDIHIDRDKAGLLDVSMNEIANALSSMLSDNYANWFSLGGYSYQVIPQVQDDMRQTDQQLNQIYVKNGSGQMLPLSTFVTYTTSVQPSTLNQFNQLNSVTIQGMLMPGVTVGQGLDYLTATAQQMLPKEMNINYAGQSLQFIQEGNSMLYAFMLALIIIYLVLAAQFESFRDPIIVLVSVPMSICGALIPLYLGAATINIYTEVGLITLIGLISKHGILMVEFANKLQEQGKAPLEAIIESATIRLRPILMTTFAMVFGVVPLILATGAGAVSRFDVGLVIACGMTIGTCFTLFVVPTMYTYIAKVHHKIAEEEI
jgi:multidrug efflux pump